MDQRPFRSQGNLNHFKINTNQLTTTKAAVLQVPIGFCDDEIQIMEADVRLPMHYTPAVGSFISHRITKGRIRINWWGLDLQTQKVILSLDIGVCYEDLTPDEWLRTNPRWHIAKDPILTIKRKDDDESWDTDM